MTNQFSFVGEWNDALETLEDVVGRFEVVGVIQDSSEYLEHVEEMRFHFLGRFLVQNAQHEDARLGKSMVEVSGQDGHTGKRKIECLALTKCWSGDEERMRSLMNFKTSDHSSLAAIMYL